MRRPFSCGLLALALVSWFDARASDCRIFQVSACAPDDCKIESVVGGHKLAVNWNEHAISGRSQHVEFDAEMTIVGDSDLQVTMHGSGAYLTSDSPHGEALFQIALTRTLQSSGAWSYVLQIVPRNEINDSEYWIGECAAIRAGSADQPPHSQQAVDHGQVIAFQIGPEEKHDPGPFQMGFRLGQMLKAGRVRVVMASAIETDASGAPINTGAQVVSSAVYDTGTDWLDVKGTLESKSKAFLAVQGFAEVLPSE